MHLTLFIGPVLSDSGPIFLETFFFGIWRATVIKISSILFRKTDDGSGSTTRFTITLEKADACLPLIVQNQEDFWMDQKIHKMDQKYPRNANLTIVPATRSWQANENPSVSFPIPADFKNCFYCSITVKLPFHSMTVKHFQLHSSTISLKQ